MVPRAERKISGVGESDNILLAQVKESGCMMGFKFDDSVERLFRAMACTVRCDERESKGLRMCEPYRSTVS